MKIRTLPDGNREIGSTVPEVDVRPVAETQLIHGPEWVRTGALPMSTNQNEERLATIAYILDRVEHVAASSSTRAFATEIVSGLAEGRHIDCDRAGEYDDLLHRVRWILKSHAGITPLVRRPKLKLVR